MDDMIYNQRDIPKDRLRYGLRSSAKTGCGWIATYNALKLMGYHMDREKLIRLYEKQVPLLNGNAGTVLWGPALLFHKWGFPIRTGARQSGFDELVKSSDAAILYYWWRSGMRIGAHFIALEYKDGCFVGYNTYSNSTGPDRLGPSLQAFLNQHKYFGTFLVGIRKKETQKNNP